MKIENRERRKRLVLERRDFLFSTAIVRDFGMELSLELFDCKQTNSSEILEFHSTVALTFAIQ